jgi:hypothetical protein
MSAIIKSKNPRQPHSWHYRVDVRQLKRSSATTWGAQDFKLNSDHDTRTQIFADDKLGYEDFGVALDA